MKRLPGTISAHSRGVKRFPRRSHKPETSGSAPVPANRGSPASVPDFFSVVEQPDNRLALQAGLGNIGVFYRAINMILLWGLVMDKPVNAVGLFDGNDKIRRKIGRAQVRPQSQEERDAVLCYALSIGYAYPMLSYLYFGKPKIKKEIMELEKGLPVILFYDDRYIESASIEFADKYIEYYPLKTVKELESFGTNHTVGDV
jgi:hypothetical protein